MDAVAQQQRSELLRACADAVAELDDALRAVTGDPERAAQQIALLHVLEERAHEAFAALREHVLHRG